MTTKITYKNNNLIAITNTKHRIFKLGDFVNLDLFNNYNISGRIIDIEDNRFTLTQGETSTYRIGFDYIRRIS